MRILFLRHHMINVGGTGIYTKILIEELVRRGHTIGLWPTDRMVYKDLYELPIVCMKHNDKSISADWDIIVIQNNETLLYANHIVQKLGNIPHVFISHSSLPNDQVVPYGQLYRVIKIADTIDNGWGIPDGLINVIYNPVDLPFFVPYECKENPPYNILLVSRLNPDRIELVRDIISALNHLPDYRLHVVGGGLDYLLKSISNKNIVFEGQQVQIDNYFRKADIVIGSGRTAVEGMSHSKPVIIAGLRGLGGLITIENYERFRNMMFSGRYKGKLYERIPREGLITSILAAQKNSSLADIVCTNHHNVGKDFGMDKIATQFERVLYEVKKLHHQIHDDKEILNLKPLFNANCEIFRNGDDNTFEMYRIDSGQYLGYMDKRGRALVTKFDGEHTLEDCGRSAGFKPGEDLSEFIQITREFWYQKIITF